MKPDPLPPGHSAKAHKQRRMGVGGCLAIVGGLFGLLMILLVVGYLIFARAGERRIAEHLAELRAAGHPTTTTELEDFYDYPPPQNNPTQLILAANRQWSTDAFGAAAKDLPIVGSSEKEIPPPGQPWEEVDAARALLDQYSSALEMLHEAADRGAAARFPLQFDAGFEMTLEHAQQLRTAARMLALETHVRAHEGDAHGAAQSIRALLTLARSIEKEPVVISQLVGWACGGIGRELIVDLLPHVDFADEDLAMLQQELRKAEVAEGLRRALIGERVLGIDAMRHPEKLRDWDTSSGMPPRLGPRYDDMALYLDTMGRLIEATERPWPEAQELAAQVAQDVEKTATGSLLAPVRYTMSFLLLPAIDAMIAAGARTEASQDVVDVMIAMERFRRDESESPRSLQALVPDYLPAVPSDPFDGQPLRYVLEEDELVIYSIGRDHIDNGGQGDLDGEPDISVRLPK